MVTLYTYYPSLSRIRVAKKRWDDFPAIIIQLMHMVLFSRIIAKKVKNHRIPKKVKK